MSTRRTFPWWLAIGAAAVATAAPKEPSAPARVDPDTLLRAINFVLTASDASTYKWKSVDDCVVISDIGGAAAHITDVIHFNNVDFSRISIQSFQLKYPDRVEDWVEVRLHGEGVIREGSMQFKQGDDTTVHEGAPEMEYTYKRQTKEYERMVRAWKYIYSHGCRSARSSF